MKAKKEKITEDQVQGFRYLKRIRPLLARLHEVGCQRDKAGNRQLFFDDYCALVLLYQFNPLIDSMRMLQVAGELGKVQQTLEIKRFSLGSFSESPAVFEAERLQEIIGELAIQIRPMAVDQRLSQVKYVITLVDGTLLRALPKLMESWCSTKKDGQPLHQWKLHVHLEVGMPAPVRFERTTGHGNLGDERKNLKKNVEAGRCYVTDRLYYDVSVLNAIHLVGSGYVCRARDDLKYQVIENRPLDNEDRPAGILQDAIVKIGEQREQPPNHAVRLVMVESELHPKRTRQGTVTSCGKVFIITNQLDLPAWLIALIYRYRWSIELFFRFLKQTLGCRHLLSQRPGGIDIQVYCAVIACLLIHLETGRKPNKAMARMMGFYLSGLATEEEAVAFLNRPDRTGVKRAAQEGLSKKV
jgi:hypothetical protein